LPGAVVRGCAKGYVRDSIHHSVRSPYPLAIYRGKTRVVRPISPPAALDRLRERWVSSTCPVRRGVDEGSVEVYEDDEEPSATDHDAMVGAPPLRLAGVDEDGAEPHVVRGID
jgi:hypothetical protein